MVSKNDDMIDFGKLEAEVYDAVEADAHYHRENDAKFRAVHQRVATYDEFRDIVLASHIKPLEKKDLINAEAFKQQWNICASKNCEEDQTSNTESQRKTKLTVIPKNGHEFTKEWRKLSKTEFTDKYIILLELGGSTLGTIFKAEVNFGLLGEFINVLHAEYKETDAHDVLCILEHLSKTNRFKLSVDFMSKKEKETCEKLFDKIQQVLEDEEGSESLPLLKQTMESYGLK